MESEKSLVDFPQAFYPLVVVTGDRREEVPQSKADLLAYSYSVTDVTYLLHLKLHETDIYTDKYFVLYDKDTLRAKFGRTNLLVIGSPAVNLLTRIINDDMLFRFNIQEDTKSRLEAQVKILDKIKFDKTGLAIYKELLSGASTPEEAIVQTKFLATKKAEMERKYKWLFEEFKDTELRNYKSLLHEFDRPGIVDSIDKTVHGASPKSDRDYGLVSIAKHPFAEQDKYVAICAAGVHGIATSQCLKLLSENRNFENHPFGGVLETQINTFGDWMERFFDVTITWETSGYDSNHPNIPPKLRSVISPVPQTVDAKMYRKIYLSTPYRKDDLKQKNFNEKIKKTCTEFYEAGGYSCEVLEPFSLPKGGGAGTTFTEKILDHMRDRNFVIHDITGLARGVLFEIGYSIGANIDNFLIWDDSRGVKFDINMIPALLKNLHIEAVDFKFPFFDKELSEKILARSLEPTIAKNANVAMPHAPTSKKALVKTSDSDQESKKTIISTLKSHDIDVLTAKDIPKLGEPRMTIQAIKMANYIFIDITDNYYDGIIALGICRALNLRNVMMLARMDEDLSMWDGPKCFWSADENLMFQGIQDEVSGFIKSLQNR